LPPPLYNYFLELPWEIVFANEYVVIYDFGIGEVIGDMFIMLF
tara:strand:+ start:200 stop:328 length:129 start_codon:yes stop_codon:yes gene_type:complete